MTKVERLHIISLILTDFVLVFEEDITIIILSFVVFSNERLTGNERAPRLTNALESENIFYWQL